MIFEVQRFEQTFFNLLNLHHQNLSALEQRYHQESAGDTHFFGAVFRYIDKHSAPDHSPVKRSKAYLSFYTQHYNHIDHFVRHLLFSVQFVLNSQSFEEHPRIDTESERTKYIDMLQAQLSTDELSLLYYHVHLDPRDQGQRLISALQNYAFFARVPEKHRPLEADIPPPT